MGNLSFSNSAILAKRSVANARRKRIKAMDNADRLKGMSSNGNDLYRYLLFIISKRNSNDKDKYYITLDTKELRKYGRWLSPDKMLSDKTLDRAKKEIIERNIIIKCDTKDNKFRYFFNFRDFGYIGDWKIYIRDLAYYKKFYRLSEKDIEKIDKETPEEDKDSNDNELNI